MATDCVCGQVYAVIKEKWSSRPGETICASSRRDELVYSSLSNLVEIRVVAARRTDYFMMKIEGSLQHARLAVRRSGGVVRRMNEVAQR